MDTTPFLDSSPKWGGLGWQWETTSDLKYRKTLTDTIKYKLTELFSVLFKKKSIFSKKWDDGDLDFSPEPGMRE